MLKPYKQRAKPVNDNTIRIIKAKTKSDVLFLWMISGYLGIIAGSAAFGLYLRWDKVLLAGL